MYAPNRVTELFELCLVVGLKRLLRLDDDAILEAAPAEYDRCMDEGVLQQDGLWRCIVRPDSTDNTAPLTHWHRVGLDGAYGRQH